VLVTAVLGASILLGAAAQRVTGLGFALVAAPLLTLVAGPVEGVAVANALAIALSAAVLAQTWRHVSWRRAGLLVAAALPGIAVGAVVVLRAPAPLVLVLVGSAVVVGVALVMRGIRLRWFRGSGGAVLAGVTSGFMNSVAGVGGPVLAIHSASDAWDGRTFVATAQAYFIGTNALSLAFKGLPSLDTTTWAVAGGCLVAGVLGGSLLAPRIPAHATRRAILVLALLAGLATLVRGGVALLATA